MELLEKMGYHKIGNPVTAMMENATILSEMICDEIDAEFATMVIEAAYAEGLDPYAEGMFGTTFNPLGGVRSVARDAKQLIGRGWQFIKDMIKKVIEMIKNILKDFFAAERQVGKLLNDCKKALKERIREIRDNNKVMKVITFESLTELNIPIHEAIRGSYSAKLLLMCGLLDKASTQKSDARAKSGESYNYSYGLYGFGEVNPNESSGKPPQNEQNTDTDTSSDGSSTRKTEDGKDIDVTGKPTGDTATVDEELENGYNEMKNNIHNENADYSNRTKDGQNASEV